MVTRIGGSAFSRAAWTLTEAKRMLINRPSKFHFTNGFSIKMTSHRRRHRIRVTPFATCIMPGHTVVFFLTTGEDETREKIHQRDHTDVSSPKRNWKPSQMFTTFCNGKISNTGNDTSKRPDTQTCCFDNKTKLCSTDLWNRSDILKMEYPDCARICNSPATQGEGLELKFKCPASTKIRESERLSMPVDVSF